MVGSGMTGDDGSVAIKVERAMTSGNMVNASVSVSAAGYKSDPDARTAVSWDPQSFTTEGSNENDIVNLNVNVNVSGATVDRGDYGGGEALAGWAISVMMGDAEVAGAPTALGADGSASFTTTVESVPASFTFTVADDQDDDLDGGEMYEASGGGYTHTGLKVAGAMDGDPIVVTYTTQTLKVYVHHERDQVRGYTGNVLDGDIRASLVDLEVRQASGSGGRFTSPISNDDWDARANSSGSRGVHTFSHLPADMDIVVRASAADGYMLLDKPELDAYRNMDENGVMGGAFGAMGGWGHTVTLCPLTETEPTGQDFGKCGSFAVVSTYDVTANVSKMRVRKSGAGFNSADPSSTHQSGITVSLSPVEGKNLAGVGREFTTASSNDPTTAHDERMFHDFGTMASGAYELGIPDGWMAMVGDAEAAGALSPLADDARIEVTPSTATLYGFVRNMDRAGLANVTVTVNGQTATTDDLGRYIVSGISRVRGQLFVNTERAGYPATRPDSTNNASTAVPTFQANTAKRFDFELSGANNTVAITGTVTESGTGAGIKGVRIKVDEKDPLNGLPSGSKKGQLLTGDDGTYTAVVAVQPNNDPLVDVTASKAGYHFIPATRQAPAIAGGSQSIDFTGYAATEITGRVAAPGGNVSMSDVTVTAYSDPGRTNKIAGGSATTTETGTFSVLVPTLSGTVYLKAEPRELKPGSDDFSTPKYDDLVAAQNYVWFDAPTNRPGGAIAVIPGQVLQFGTFTGNSVQPRITSVIRGKVKGAFVAPPLALVNDEDSTTIVVKWEFDTRNLSTTSGGNSYSVADGATFTPGGFTGTPTSAQDPATVGGDTDRADVTDGTSVTHKRTTTFTIGDADAGNYGELDITVGIDVVGAEADATAAAATSAELTLDAVDHGATGVTVTRKGHATAATDSIAASWGGEGSPALEHRVALLVKVGTANRVEWLVVPTALASITRNLTAGNGNYGKWELGDIVLAGTGAITVTATEWTADDGSGFYPGLESRHLRAATQLRVDTRVTGSGDWKKGPPAAIPPNG
ncbi:MAG: hypothetical protein OXJ54_14610 [Gemmatimonadetes bacterium]|nr:hypothetical protein [Candidatus Palauibacter rhopaloidicola]